MAAKGKSAQDMLRYAYQFFGGGETSNETRHFLYFGGMTTRRPIGSAALSLTSNCHTRPSLQRPTDFTPAPDLKKVSEMEAFAN